MKYILLTFSAAALLGLPACQQHPTTQTAAAPAAGVAAAARPVAAAAPSLPPPLRALLASHDVAKLLEKAPDNTEVMNGFYGPDHYRVEFVLLSVRPDADNPALLHVRGMDRYKGTVTPFEGEVRLTRLEKQPPMTARDLALVREYGGEEENDSTAQALRGTFELREAPDRQGAGVITGAVAIDFRVDEQGQLQRYSQGERSPSERGGVTFEGTWRSNLTQKTQPVVWVADVFNYGPKLFDEFAIGGREPDFNPKYAKLGWDTYWENDEWWAEPNAATARAAASADSL